MKSTTAITCSLLILAIQSGCSQSHQTAARLNATPAGSLVMQAIDAHGGLDAWYASPTSSFDWEYSNTGMNMRFKSHAVVDNKTRQAYHAFKEYGTPAEPAPVTGNFAWNGQNAWISPPDFPQKLNPRFWALTGYYFQLIPFVLADPGVQYQALPDEKLDGHTHRIVKCSFNPGVGDFSGDTYTLYIHPQTSRVSAIRYTVTYGRAHPTPPAPQSKPKRETLFYYLDPITVDGLTTATRYEGYSYTNGEKGRKLNEGWASNLSFRTRFDASRLSAPTDARWVMRPEEK